MDIEKTVCHRCFAVLDAGDKFCRHCGTSTGDASADMVPVYVVPETAAPPKRPAWSDGPWMILFLLLVVLGPLALPMLWRSRHFGLPAKIALTVLLVALTILILYLIWFVLHKALEPLEELRKMQAM